MYSIKATCVLIVMGSMVASGTELRHHPKLETISFRIAAISKKINSESI